MALDELAKRIFRNTHTWGSAAMAAYVLHYRGYVYQSSILKELEKLARDKTIAPLYVQLPKTEKGIQAIIRDEEANGKPTISSFYQVKSNGPKIIGITRSEPGNLHLKPGAKRAAQTMTEMKRDFADLNLKQKDLALYFDVLQTIFGEHMHKVCDIYDKFGQGNTRNIYSMLKEFQNLGYLNESFSDKSTPRSRKVEPTVEGETAIGIYLSFVDAIRIFAKATSSKYRQSDRAHFVETGKPITVDKEIGIVAEPENYKKIVDACGGCIPDLIYRIRPKFQKVSPESNHVALKIVDFSGIELPAEGYTAFNPDVPIIGFAGSHYLTSSLMQRGLAKAVFDNRQLSYDGPEKKRFQDSLHRAVADNAYRT